MNDTMSKKAYAEGFVDQLIAHGLVKEAGRGEMLLSALKNQAPQDYYATVGGRPIQSVIDGLEQALGKTPKKDYGYTRYSEALSKVQPPGGYHSPEHERRNLLRYLVQGAKDARKYPALPEPESYAPWLPKAEPLSWREKEELKEGLIRIFNIHKKPMPKTRAEQEAFLKNWWQTPADAAQGSNPLRDGNV